MSRAKGQLHAIMSNYASCSRFVVGETLSPRYRQPMVRCLLATPADVLPRPETLEMPARAAARKVTALFLARNPDASGPPRAATLPWFDVSESEPTGTQTIVGIGVGEPNAVSTWAHQAPTRKLVAVRAALPEPTVAQRPASTPAHSTTHAGLVPGVVPAPMQSAAPALLGKMPVLEREVFQLARRIALQADLPAAMRVLHHGLSRLTDSPDVTCVLFDAALCSAWVVPDGSGRRGIDDQVQQLVARVAGSGRRAVLGHALIEPVGPAPARAVFLIRRPPTSTVYGDLEIATVAAIAAAVVGLIGHFVAEHVARREHARRDARSVLRPGAPAATAAPGCVVPTARTWMRWAYPTLIGLVAAMVTAAAIIQVPTYSTGVSTITVEGELVSVVALLPGHDRPRLDAGMALQLELSGRHDQREQAVIDAIDSQVIGPEEVRKRLGDPIGDALPGNGPVVIVRAHLTARTSGAGGRAYELHDGMLGKAEVKVDHQSLLRVLLHGKAR